VLFIDLLFVCVRSEKLRTP